MPLHPSHAMPCHAMPCHAHGSRSSDAVDMGTPRAGGYWGAACCSTYSLPGEAPEGDGGRRRIINHPLYHRLQTLAQARPPGRLCSLPLLHFPPSPFPFYSALPATFTLPQTNCPYFFPPSCSNHPPPIFQSNDLAHHVQLSRPAQGHRHGTLKHALLLLLPATPPCRALAAPPSTPAAAGEGRGGEGRGAHLRNPDPRVARCLSCGDAREHDAQPRRGRSRRSCAGDDVGKSAFADLPSFCFLRIGCRV